MSVKESEKKNRVKGLGVWGTRIGAILNGVAREAWAVTPEQRLEGGYLWYAVLRDLHAVYSLNWGLFVVIEDKIMKMLGPYYVLV